MYNYVMLIGQIKNVEVKNDTESFVELSVIRPFKNEDGNYSSDLFKIGVFGALRDVSYEFLKVGKRLAVKGRLICDENNAISIVAERFVFLNNENKS